MRVLLAGTLLLFLLRAALSLIRSGPVLVADEMGYLGNARAIVGGIGAQMELAPFYRGGYSLLIAPRSRSPPTRPSGITWCSSSMRRWQRPSSRSSISS